MSTETNSQKLLAYHKNPELKEQLIAQLQAHYDADEIVQGTYWENGRGCAVGCTVHSNDHWLYPVMWGIPAEIGKLQDMIFERLPLAEAKEFPLKFARVIPVGADLGLVTSRFLHWLLADPEHGVRRLAKRKDLIQAVDTVISLYERRLAGDEPQAAEWLASAKAAWAAVGASEAAAEAAAGAWAAAASAEAAEWLASAKAAWAAVGASEAAAEAAEAAAGARAAAASAEAAEASAKAAWAAVGASEAAAEAAAGAAAGAWAAAAAAAEAAEEAAAGARAVSGANWRTKSAQSQRDYLLRLLAEAPVEGAG